MLQDWRVVRTFNQSIWIFLGVWALIGFSYFGIQAVLLNLYLLRLGFGSEFIGLLGATGQIIWAVCALPAGIIGRRIGLRAALITANALTTVGMGSFLLVEAAPRPLWTVWLLLWWGVVWAGAGLLTVNSIPYLMQVTTQSERSHAFSAQGAVIGLMGFVGSLVAGVLPMLLIGWAGDSLDHPGPYRYALWVAPLSYALCTLAWFAARPVRLVEAAEAQAPAPRPIALLIFLAVVVFLQTLGAGAVDAFFNVYLDVQLHVPTAQIGTIIGVGQLLSILAVLIAPQLLLRWRSTLALAGTSAGVGVALLPLATLPHWIGASIGFTGVVAMTSVGAPIRSIFSQELVMPRWRTTTSAITTVSMALGSACIAAVGGYLIAWVGFSGLFLISAALSFAAAIPLLVYVRVHTRRAQVA